MFLQISGFHTLVKFWVAGQWDPVDSLKHYRQWLMVLVTLHNLMVRPCCWRYHTLVMGHGHTLVMGHGKKLHGIQLEALSWLYTVHSAWRYYTCYHRRKIITDITHLQNNLPVRYAHCYKCGINIVRVIKHHLIGLRLASWDRTCIWHLSMKNLKLGKHWPYGNTYSSYSAKWTHQ